MKGNNSVSPQQKPLRGPSAWRWAAALLVLLLAALMLVPAAYNTALGAPALIALGSDTLRLGSSALREYQVLAQMGRNAESWSAENYSLLGSDAPGLTTGNFAGVRIARLYCRVYAAYDPVAVAYHLAENFPAGSKLPRSLRADAALFGALYAAVQKVNAEAGRQAEQAGEADVAQAIAAARGKDGDRSHAIYYDTLALLYSTKADERDALIAKIKKDPAAQPWMTEGSVLHRAMQSGDYAVVRQIAAVRLRRNTQDLAAKECAVKAAYLQGDPAQSAQLAARFAKSSAVWGYPQLVLAELAAREGDYKKADEICAAVEANAAARQNGAATVSAAVRGEALLLQGKAQQAFDGLKAAAEETWYYPGAKYFSALLAAALAAGDEDYYSDFTRHTIPAYADAGLNYQLPQKLRELRDGGTTIAKIFTEGWGGFDA